jgi:hypothetical protein
MSLKQEVLISESISEPVRHAGSKCDACGDRLCDCGYCCVDG